MAQITSEQQNQKSNKKDKSGSASQHQKSGQNETTKTPMIVGRVNKIPMVNMAISMGFSQYDKLKTSNVTVGDLMTKAESWAVYVWEKVQPIVEKLQDPIHKADQLACNTFDFVQHRIDSVKLPETFLGKQLPALITPIKETISNIKESVIHKEQQQQQQSA